ncbi:MAG: HAD family hydrolase [Gammaproteobacteria bacterium]
MNLALFDLDHTLLDGDRDDLWYRFLAEEGVVDDTSCVEEGARFSADYRAGRLEMLDFYSFVLQPLADNTSHQLLDWRRRFVAERILPHIASAARALPRKHRDAGHTLAIITATNRFITEPEYDGTRFTGRVSGIPCFREGKLIHLRAWLHKEKLVPARRPGFIPIPTTTCRSWKASSTPWR